MINTPHTTSEAPVMGRGLKVAVVLLVFFAYLLYLVRGALPPFIIAIAIAAMLDPLLVRLQTRGIARIWSVLIVYFLFFFLFGAFLIWVVPLTISQAEQLAKNWPTLIEQLKANWGDIAHHPMVRRLHLPLPDTWSQLSTQVNTYVNNVGPNALRSLLGGVQGAVGYVLNIVVILLATFYLLNDWPRIRRRVHYLIPPQFREDVVDVMDGVGAVFLGYLRGLTTLCALYGVSVTCVLLFRRVDYAFVLGLAAAVLYAIPYVGSVSMALLTGVVSFVGTGGNVAASGINVALVLALNQIFDTIFTPRVLGKSTGIHPLISLFALMAGAQLLGFVGFIIGVPVAASIAIIATALYPRLAEEIPNDADVPSAEPEPKEPAIQ